MVIEASVEWPNKSQAAVLAANTSWKRTTKFTPFFLMYGREANCAHVLEDVPFSDDEDDQSNELYSIDSQTDWIESLMDMLQAKCV